MRLPSRPMLIGCAVVLVVLAAVVVEVLRVHGGVAGTELASSWQLLDLGVLRDNPLAVWYLHTQPPLHNLVIGLVAWSVLPLAGTVFVLYVVALAVMGLLLLDLMVRWDVPVVAATVVASLAVANPALLSTIRIASYEVPLAALLVAFVWCLDRHLARPSARWLAAVVGLGLALVMTRALFHPIWLALVLAVVLMARPLGWRLTTTAVAVPLVVIGGWAAKNAVLVDSASLSSWTGFNLQRGVIGPMPAGAVEAAIAAGDVTALAAQPPWRGLDEYTRSLGGCRPADRNAALSRPAKTVGASEVPNFNDECYLPLYRESRRNALTMIRREPGEYLRDRALAIGFSHAYTPLGLDGEFRSLFGERLPTRSWMDGLFSAVMVRQTIDVDMRDWTVPLYGDRFRLELAWPLVFATVLVLCRAGVAAGRAWRQRPSPEGREVVWLVSGITVAAVVVGGDLVELGENGRFRSMLDPLLFALVAVEVTCLIRAIRARRRG